MELKTKGFKLICTNCNSEEVRIYEDKEKKKLFLFVKNVKIIQEKNQKR